MKKVLLAAALPVSLLASNVMAGEFFIGANAGTSDASGLNEVCDEVREQSFGLLPIGCAVTEDSDTTLSFSAGYNFNRIFGLEAGYTDLGEYEITVSQSRVSGTVTADGDFAYAALVLSAPFTESFSASIRLGGANANLDVAFEGLEESLEDETVAFVGASLDYRVTDNLSVQVRYDDFDELSITSAGVRLHF